MIGGSNYLLSCWIFFFLVLQRREREVEIEFSFDLDLGTVSMFVVVGLLVLEEGREELESGKKNEERKKMMRRKNSEGKGYCHFSKFRTRIRVWVSLNVIKLL